MTLTKSVIVENIYSKCGLAKNLSARAVESVLEIVKSTLENGESVMISGFGKLEVREKSARRGRNPHTGDDLTLAPRKVVTFKCSGVLREKINGKSR